MKGEDGKFGDGTSKELNMNDTFTTPKDFEKAKDMWYEGKRVGEDEGYFIGWREGLRNGLGYNFEDDDLKPNVQKDLDTDDNNVDEINKIMKQQEELSKLVEKISLQVSNNEKELKNSGKIGNELEALTK